MDDSDDDFERRQRPKIITNSVLWDEIRYIRSKVDALESKVMIIFGTVTAISTAIALYELLRSKL